MELIKKLGWAAIALALISCNNTEKSDAYGQFEADEVTISAEASGTLQQFEVKEGMQLEAGQQVGLVDTVQLSLRKRELKASVQSIRTNIEKLEAQADVYREQLQTAQKELTRFQNLKETNAATQQQIDQAEGQVNVLEKQIASVQVQKKSVYAELETMQTRIAQVEDQLQRAQIINPVEGRVLSVFVEPHELVSTGRPLYQIAGLEELTLRVYVSGAQLPDVTLGSDVEVLIDKDADSNERLSGTVSWIASEAEFTPRMIQTKEERVTQVYAVKVRVPNPEGKLKIGMPGEVNF
ncbi:HlyD family secretion protein [Gracilimonas mengyeensis]|uniref:HlyD family secretion protein n=1 Tax=Gracilimonas mengyeensis TaxID=1302730 RepID=A0A521EE14_9BACT|nr:efflux RND transporter periplasmic adaptor subunit [Gracilimonas mengyeensis]SMO81430.1 HlyD family secretion protein [Gracilimonas mengyeensis]